MAEPSDDAKKLSATILKRTAQMLQTAGINAVVTAVQLPELIDLYLASARKKGRAEGEAEGRRKVSEVAAAIVSRHPSEHPQCEDFRGCCELMEEQIAALREAEEGG